MHRRSIIAGLLALVGSKAVAQVRVEGPGVVNLPTGRARIIPHGELATLWSDIARSRSMDALSDAIGGRFGRFPWVFSGSIRLTTARDGTPGYEVATVRILAIRSNAEDVILSTPSVIVDYEIVEPIGLHSGLRSRRVALASGGM